MTSSKRKHEDSDYTHGQKEQEKCIVHFDTSNNESFVFLHKCKGPENRLEKFQEICDLRLAQPDGRKRMEESCRHVPETLLPEHGHHRDCYQRFTNKYTE